jgi:hypothetical protein
MRLELLSSQFETILKCALKAYLRLGKSVKDTDQAIGPEFDKEAPLFILAELQEENSLPAY